MAVHQRPVARASAEDVQQVAREALAAGARTDEVTGALDLDAYRAGERGQTRALVSCHQRAGHGSRRRYMPVRG